MSHAHAFDYHFHIQACAQGRSQALHTLFLHEAPVMLALADTWLTDEPRARQAVSDTFMLIWRHASHYPGQPEQARAWLYSILRHRLKYDPREQEHIDPVRWHSLPQLSGGTLAALLPADKRVLQAAYCLGCSPQALAQLTPHAQTNTLRQTLATLVHAHGLAEPALCAADHQALAAYVLGLTDDLARRRAEGLLQSQPTAAGHVLHWEGICLAFADALAPAPAAHALLTAICHQLQLPAPAPTPLKPARPAASPSSTAPAAASDAAQAHRQTQDQAEAPTPLLRVPASNNTSAASGAPSAAAIATTPPASAPSPAPTRTAASAGSPKPAATAARQDAPPHADTAPLVKQPGTPSPSTRPSLRAEPQLAAQPQPPAYAPEAARAPAQPYTPEAAPRRRPALLPWAGALAVALALGIAGYRWLASASQAAAPLTPPVTVQQIAVLQAPGSSSTPGWLLTQSSDLQLNLKPLVNIEVAPTEAVYLWTQTTVDPEPRLLSRVMPDMPLRLTAEQAGPVQAGQIFEMTLEPIRDALPAEPEGPVLFIGRTIDLDDAAPAQEGAGASGLRNP